MVGDLYNELIEKYPLGKMDPEDFKKVFRLAFPERPEEKLTALTEKLRNVEKTDGSIRKCKSIKLVTATICIVVNNIFSAMHAIAMLLYLFSDAKKEENLGQASISITESTSTTCHDIDRFSICLTRMAMETSTSTSF